MMKGGKNMKTYRTWLASYLLIICVAFLCSTLIYTVIGNVVKREVDRSNAVILDNVQLSTDAYINDMQKISLKLGNNEKLGLACSKDIDDNYFSYLSLVIRKEFSQYQNLNTGITNIYFYIKQKDYVISPVRSTRADVAFEIMYKDTGITFEEWKEKLFENSKSFFCEMPALGQNGVVRKELALVRPLMVHRGVPGGVLVVAMDGESITQVMRHGEFEQDSQIFLLSAQDDIILSNTEMRLPLDYEDLLDRDQLKIHYDGQRYIVSSLRSGRMNMRYVLAIPEKTYYKTAILVRNISFVGVFAFLGMALFLAFRLLKRNYKPIRDLMGYVETVYSDVGEDNEYHLFRSAITKAVVEKKQMQSRLEQQRGLLKDQLLIQLLKGKTEDAVDPEDTLFACGADFDGKNYQVLVFYVEYFDELFEGSSVEVEEQTNLAALVVQNITQEILDKYFKTVFVEVEDMMVCILNTDQENSKEELRLLQDAVKEAQKIIWENFYIEFTIAVSALHEGVHGISSAYQEAMEAMEYKIVFGKKEIICYEELGGTQENYYYPTEKELMLINLLKAGELEKAKDLLDEILRRNFEEKHLSLEMARCVIFNLVSTILKVIEDLKSHPQVDLTAEIDALSRLLNRMDVEDIREKLYAVFEKICRSVPQKKDSSVLKMVEQVKEYVAENYRDFNLSLYSISENYGVTYTYLSRVFKMETGEGLLQYINRIRMETAKKLLLQTEKSLAEIAKEVGYGNSNSLIRVFKKFNGITPGKYRETGDKT